MRNKTLFQKHQASITMLLLGVYFVINGFINSTTVIMEAMRSPPLPFEQWEPFVWEYSSAFASFVLVLWLSRVLLLLPWNWQRPMLSVGIYGLMALVFSLTHIAFMIFIREIVYFFMGGNYEFALGLEQWMFELFYELRKDIWSFTFFVILIWGYRYIVAQWLGDAKDINLENNADALTEDTEKDSDLLLIKKLGREFLVNKNEIEWVESSGNYLNLHIAGNVFPMRGTFKSFLENNTHLPIKRVHRSYAVNLNYVSNLTLTSSGDGNIELTSGQTVKMSRRYKLHFE